MTVQAVVMGFICAGLIVLAMLFLGAAINATRGKK